MKMYKYAMIDTEVKRTCFLDTIWVIETDCPKEKFKELCEMSHQLRGTEYKGVLLDECDSEALEQLLEIEGYKWESDWIPRIEW